MECTRALWPANGWVPLQVLPRHKESFAAKRWVLIPVARGRQSIGSSVGSQRAGRSGRAQEVSSSVPSADQDV